MTKTRRSLMVLLFMTMVLSLGLFLPSKASKPVAAAASTIRVKAMIRTSKNLTWQEVPLSPTAPGPFVNMSYMMPSERIEAMAVVSGSASEMASVRLSPQTKFTLLVPAGAVPMDPIATSRGTFINGDIIETAIFSFAQGQAQAAARAMIIQLVRDEIADVKRTITVYGRAGLKPS
jgi:hypothetical protein